MKEIPEPPEAPDSLVDVGKSCDECGRNVGMYPVADMCQYCRPIEQPNGDIITAIGYSPEGNGDIERVPNTYVKIQENGIAKIEGGIHSNCVWLNDGPQISSSGAQSFFLGTRIFPPPTFYIRFRKS